MSLLLQWKGWSHLFRSRLFGLLKSWRANFEWLQVIDLMEKVTKEQSKEATKSNGSFLGSWSWVIEPMIEGRFIRLLMSSQIKMVGISCQFKSFVIMSSVWPSEIWIFMVHNATKLHIMTLNYHIRVFGMESGPNLFFLRIVYFWICQCVFEKNIARRRARLRTGPSLACMEATATKRPSAAHYYNPRQSSSLRLSLQKDNPTLALYTLT